MNPQNLRIPGPTPVPPEVMGAMQRAMLPHRGGDFRAFHLAMREKLREILGTRQHVFAIPGSGSIGWEAAIVNTLAPGDQVLAMITGDFGVRFTSVAERFGLEVTRVTLEPGQAASLDEVSAELDRNPDIRAILYTHNETSTGVMNPLEGLGDLAQQHQALLLVDAVSSAGAVTIDTDRLGIDVLISGSQKGWMCPPGLSILAVSDNALGHSSRAVMPRAFLDFLIWRDSAVNGDTPATAPLTSYFALDAACDLILEEGMDRRTDRHLRAAASTRSALADHGFQPLVSDDVYASPTVTAMSPPHGVGVKRLVDAVRERYHIEVAAGQAGLSDKIIRIGHMGWFAQEDIARAVSAVVACATELAEQSQGS